MDTTDLALYHKKIQDDYYNIQSSIQHIENEIIIVREKLVKLEEHNKLVQKEFEFLKNNINDNKNRICRLEDKTNGIIKDTATISGAITIIINLIITFITKIKII